MQEGLADLFPLILAATLGALGLAPVLIRGAAQLGLVDVPGSAPHKRHTSVTPLAGGPVLAGSIGLTYVVLRPHVDPLVLGIFLGGSAMFVWGMLDDRFTLRPRVKILGQIAAAAIALGFGIQVRITQNAWIDLALTLLWMVGLINAFNLVDSMDGLALGLASIALAFFVLATLDAGQPALAALSAAILGGTLGLYFNNATPARLFLGDSGRPTPWVCFGPPRHRLHPGSRGSSARRIMVHPNPGPWGTDLRHHPGGCLSPAQTEARHSGTQRPHLSSVGGLGYPSLPISAGDAIGSHPAGIGRVCRLGSDGAARQCAVWPDRVMWGRLHRGT